MLNYETSQHYLHTHNIYNWNQGKKEEFGESMSSINKTVESDDKVCFGRNGCTRQWKMTVQNVNVSP